MLYKNSKKIGKDKFEITLEVNIDDLNTLEYMALLDHAAEDKEDHWWYTGLKGKMLMICHEFEELFKH